jgi:hypothetical protein
MPALRTRLRLLIATFWVGSLWTVGYLVAPVLFSTLTDRVLAGTIAGSLFRVEAWVSVACAAILALLITMSRDEPSLPRRSCLILVFGMFACTLIGYFGVQPFMAGLRAAAGPGGIMASGAKTQFAILHGVSSAVYLMQSVLGVLLVLRIR